MEYNQLLKRVQLLKANPKLADSLPQSDFLELMAQFIGAFNSLKASIEQNKLKGDKGDDGKTPRPDVDYLAKQTAIRALNDTLNEFETKLNTSLSSIEKKVDTKLSGLRDGKDAEVTDELKREIAELAYELITLPDFATLITQETEAIRNGLELLPEGEKLAQSAIEGLVEDLQKIREAIVQKSGGGGGLSRNAVISLINQYAGSGTVDEAADYTWTGTHDFTSATVIGIGGSGADDQVASEVPFTPVGSIAATDVQTAIAELDTEKAPVSHTHAISDTTGLQAALDGKAATSHTHTVSQITDFPTLATVATSGDYDDLSNKPDLSVFDEVEQHANLAAFPGTGNSAKFYLAQDTGLLYRWTGATYAVISAELALGETSSTAYRGDRGKIAYDHSQLTTGNPHNVTKTDVGLGSVPNLDTTTAVAQTHTHANQAVLDATTASFTTADETKLDGIEAGADVTDATNVAAAGAFMKSVDDTDDITVGTTNKFATAAEKTKLGHISVTQAVDLDAIETASHAAATVTDSTSIDLTITGQDITAQREALTGAITAPKNSNTTSLGSFTKAQLDAAVSDGNVLYVGDVTQYTDELAQDAVGAMVDTTIVYNDATPSLSRAALTGAITASAGSNSTALGSFTKAQLDAAVSDGNVLYVGDVTTNATHTGDVTGATTLTIDPTAISGKTLKSTLAGTEQVLINDGGTLKRTTAQNIADLGGGGGGGLTEAQVRTIARRYAVAL